MESTKTLELILVSDQQAACTYRSARKRKSEPRESVRGPENGWKSLKVFRLKIMEKCPILKEETWWDDICSESYSRRLSELRQKRRIMEVNNSLERWITEKPLWKMSFYFQWINTFLKFKCYLGQFLFKLRSHGSCFFFFLILKLWAESIRLTPDTDAVLTS